VSARPAQRSSAARRYGGLALWLAVIVSPSVWVAAGLLAGGAVLVAVPALLRAAARRAGERAATEGARESVTLGRDPGGRTVALSDRQLAAHALIVGASGAGKSTTMLGLLSAQIRRGRPVIAIDLKGSPMFAAELERAAAAVGRRVRIFTPDGPGHWNPLAHGNATALKDKLIATERFSEPHYQRAAERYVQTVLTVLHASEPALPARLDRVVALMEPRRLAASLRGVPEPLAERVLDYLSGLTGDQVSAARGLGTRLALLSESCAGPYLVPGGPPEHTIDLRAGLEGGDVILFSLNASVYGKLAAQLGALAIQDLVSASGYRLGGPGSTVAEASAPPTRTPTARTPATPTPATVAIDEFSALGDDHVLALLARARESGISVLTATQEMADLQRAAPGFRDQVLGIVGVKIAHRQDVPESAEMIAKMAGTHWVWEETRHVRGLLNPGNGARASRRQVERFLVHPNEIKTLPVGHAVALTKLPTSEVRRVRVVRAPAAAPPDRGGPSRG
jgi:conjugal transfer pilus assembly protein TraD